MKKISYLVVLFVALSSVFSSCKKDDDDDNNSAKIVGKWNLKKEIEKEYANNQLDETDEYTYPAGAYLEFKSGGTLIWNEDGSDPEAYSYRVDGNKLTILEAGEDDEVYTIDELTSSKLVLSSEDSYMEGTVSRKEVNQYFLEK